MIKTWANRYLSMRTLHIIRIILRYVEPELKLVAKFSKKEGLNIAIDVGANVGVYTYKFSRHFSKVYAFEPQTDLYERLKNKTKKIDNIETLNCGLSDKVGEMELYIPIHYDGSANHAYATLNPIKENYKSYTVPVNTLDSYEYKNVSIIKIDVEGHEISVIRGAQYIIQRDKPVIIMEIEEKHLSNLTTVKDEIIEMQSLDYNCYYFSKKKLIKINIDDTINDVIDSNKISNFIFVNKDVYYPCMLVED